jgi:hypothetical protein
MQKDYMAMAKGQQMPKEQPQQAASNILKPGDLKSVGLPEGSSPEEAKKRVMAMLQELGVLDNLKPEILQQLQQKVDEFVQLALSGKSVEGHPILNLIQQAAQESGLEISEPTQPKAPTNFAGMMPPGGGMSGR